MRSELLIYVNSSGSLIHAFRPYSHDFNAKNALFSSLPIQVPDELQGQSEPPFAISTLSFYINNVFTKVHSSAF